jgi:hypothetical protein
MKIFDKKPKPGAKVRSKMFFTAMLRMAKLWETLKVHNGHVDYSNGVATIVFDAGGMGGGAMDYTGWSFGFSIAGAVVTVNAGKVRHGTRAAVTAAGDDFTISADNTWIFVAYTYGGTATITASTSEPVDTETVHNHALLLVTLTGTAASVGAGNIKHLGDIFIPGAFA